MQLDWFTLAAQIINFLVLVWLLKRFLYGRIVQAMNDREARIARQVDEAAEKRAQAEQLAEDLRAKHREFDAQREQMLVRAKEEAEAYRQQLLEQARAEAEAAQAQWLETLQAERRELLQELRERLGQQVFALARDTLKTLANAELEELILKNFIARLGALNTAERASITAAARNFDGSIEIRTAFPLRPETRGALIRALREHLDSNLDARFAVAPELICGVELQADSHRLVWNVDSYLEGLEDRMLDVLSERAQTSGNPS